MSFSSRVLLFVTLGLSLAGVGFSIASPWANNGSFASWALFVGVALFVAAIISGAFTLYLALHYDGKMRPEEKNPPKAH